MNDMYDRDARGHGREWEQLLFSSLLRSCSESLTNLCADGENLQLPGINELIPNVKNIFLIGPLYAEENENGLSDLQLKLEGIRITSLITPSENFLTSLNTFRETLTFLSLHIKKAETFDPTHLQVFPSLEKLHLNINNNTLEDFPAETRAKFSIIPGLCPNLEELMIMFHSAFRGINLKSAMEVISSLFKKLKVIELSRAEHQFSGRY
ncbi:unnamed protein product [Orchesella dallaii]|uniref:Uncharacterized protein n=1 Tax=Orchesella dallaii TaxID=48710 RepID=A0ABP1S8L9_9HEXA